MVLAIWTSAFGPCTIPTSMSSLLTDPRSRSVLMIALGAIVLLSAVLMIARALFQEDDLSPTRRLFAHWLPIALAALVATVLGQSEIAMSLVFGTSVAALSAVIGFLALAGPLQQVPPGVRRVWVYLPVPILLVFVLGFRGSLGVFDAVVLLIQGVLFAMVWSAAPPHDASEENEPMKAAERRPLRPLELLVLFPFAALGAYVAIRGMTGLYRVDTRYSAAVLASILLSLVLVMPMLSTGALLASKGHLWSPLTAQAGLVVMNLCVLLPLVVLLAPLVDSLYAGRLPTTFPATTPVLYPRTAWRIDTVVLLVLSLLFVPASEKRISFNRRVAPFLIVAYLVYMLFTMIMASRQ